MEWNEFCIEFTKLCIIKQIEADDIVTEAYWERLKGLKYLKKAILKAGEITYYRDFAKSITRMPEVSEIITIDKKIGVKSELSNTPKKLLAEKDYVTKHDMGNLYIDLMRFFQCDSKLLWEKLNSNTSLSKINSLSPSYIKFKSLLSKGELKNVLKNKFKEELKNGKNN